MVNMPIVGFIFTLLGIAIAGAVGGFFLARHLIKKELEKNPPINDKKTYNNGTGVIPSYLCDPVFGDINNYKALLIDTGYYTADQLK